MSEPAVAFGLISLFLFFTAVAISGLEVGTCRWCDHCRELRRREEEHRRAVRAQLDEEYRFRSPREQRELMRRQADLREKRQRSSRREGR